MSNHENAQQAMGESAGDQLRRGREKKGLSVAAVAEAQHLRPAIIQAIENGDYQQIDSELFLKGYVRAYAKQVDLDADAVVATLDKELEPLRQQRAEALEANPLVDIERRKRQKRRAAKALILLMAVAVVAFIAFSFLGNSGTQGSGAEENQPAPEESPAVPEATSSISDESEDVAEADVPVETEVEPMADVAVEDEVEGTQPAVAGEESRTEDGLTEAPLTSSDSETGDIPEPDVTRIPEVTPSTDPALTEPSRTGDVPATGRLQISFNDDCWIEVTDSSGARLVSSLQRDGDNVDVSGEVPMSVVIGAVDAVADIRFQGEAVELSDYRVVNNRAQFSLEI
jgi:cytoskeleton protein RodZ